MSTLDPALIKRELAFIKKYPAFEQRPASLQEFLGDAYLNIEKRVRGSIRRELSHIMGEEVKGDRMTAYRLAIVTGGIGIGKTTIASIVLPYLAHWVLCLKDPQGFFNLLPGSRIAFMQMSTSEQQAKEVLFGDIKARIQHSPWFQQFPFDPTFKNQLRFPKDIWIIPGDSAETTFEGYNIMGGILDEADSHKVTENKDYAEQGYTTIHTRIDSRFGQLGHGFLMIIGQMKSNNGFAARKYREFKNNAEAYAVRFAIWESFGWEQYKRIDGSRDSFWYDTKRKQIVPPVAKMIQGEHLIEIPTAYKLNFQNDPEKALRDLAGIPPAVGDAFISLVQKIDACRDKWVARHDGVTSPILPDGKIEKWFRCKDSLKRAIHIDMAYSGDGDALGMALGHVRGVETIDGEKKPYIVVDALFRMKARSGGALFLGDVRRMIYYLRDELKFRIIKVTMDGFQSQDTIQQLHRHRFESELVSVDKDLMPYHDLREAIYEERIEFPALEVHLRPGDTELTEIAVKELTELVDAGKKIDHPDGGSKDVADALAGLTYTLMGDRTYRRKVVSLDTYRPDQSAGAQQQPMHPALGESGLRAPLPPRVPWEMPSGT